MTFDLPDFESYLVAARIPLRLACTTESGWPVAVSLWFQYQSGRLFCATQKSARVVSYLQNEPRCAFEIAADMPPYCGVRGQAIATIDDETGGVVLEQLLERYLGGTKNALARNLLSKRETEVAIVLKPVKTFTWDFSSRMANVVPPMLDLVAKVCP
jgi:nitroimidazol reductase NimA-like FMN-containing flavoprotein (pyridoxamine 5'-phosphate oxidase superfamily)